MLILSFLWMVAGCSSSLSRRKDANSQPEYTLDVDASKSIKKEGC